MIDLSTRQRLLRKPTIINNNKKRVSDGDTSNPNPNNNNNKDVNEEFTTQPPVVSSPMIIDHEEKRSSIYLNQSWWIIFQQSINDIGERNTYDKKLYYYAAGMLKERVETHYISKGYHVDSAHVVISLPALPCSSPIATCLEH